MQGLLGDKLFPDLVRDLSREKATGCLTITRDGESIQVFFESGTPTKATASVPDEQIECRLVRDGLLSAEQLKTAWLAARNDARMLDQVLVDDGILSAAALAEAQMEGSRRALNLAFQWYTGDYNFDPDASLPPGAKLNSRPAECILQGARHASANDIILDAIAPDHLIVVPVEGGSGSIEQSATLNPVEGYVLSCIQSPISIWEASELTGLPHNETRRAVFVLILLGLIERQSGPDGHEESSEAVQWCPVEYASGDGRFENQYSPHHTLEAPNHYYDKDKFSDAADGPATAEHEGSLESSTWNESGHPADNAASARSALPPIEGPDAEAISGRLPSEEALYRQRLFLEERLEDETRPERPEPVTPGTVAQGSTNPGAKSFTTAIQELNIRLRLAGSVAPDRTESSNLPTPPPDVSHLPIDEEVQAERESPVIAEQSIRPDDEFVSEPEQVTGPAQITGPEQIAGPEPIAGQDRIAAPEQSAQQEPPIEEPILQQPLTFDEPLRIGPPPADKVANSISPAPTRFEAGASLPHRDSSGDERLLKKITAKLDSRLVAAASSDYYQLLGTDRLASNGKITESYEGMVALYDGYKGRWPEDAELHSKITELMSKVERAYETLGDVERRRVYDLPSARDESQDTTAIRRGGLGTALDRKKPFPESSLPRKTKRSAASPGGAQKFQPDLRNPYEAAEEYYKRGRALYERMDLHTAAHLLKEAIKLDPNRSSYYYQLGLVLSTMSQARKEHKHHKGCHVTCRLGGFLARNQRVRREAERHLLKAAELDPSNPEIKLKLGTLYKEAALDQKAQQYFYEALMLDANCELAKLELGLDREPYSERPIEHDQKKLRVRPTRK